MTPRALASPQTEALDAVADAVSAYARRGFSPLVLCDLDDTLLSTAMRHIRILREYAARPEVRRRNLDGAWRIAQAEAEHLRYAIVDTLRALGVEDAELVADLRRFWCERFFANEYLTADEPVAGAPEYCAELRARGALLVYFTGRDERMRPGTMQALAARRFPVPDGAAVRLVLKPRFDTPDLEFKGAALDELERVGPIVAGFENEPAHVNLFADRFPEGRFVLLDTKHSGRPVIPYPRIPRIRDFVRG